MSSWLDIAFQLDFPKCVTVHSYCNTKNFVNFHILCIYSFSSKEHPLSSRNYWLNMCTMVCELHSMTNNMLNNLKRPVLLSLKNHTFKVFMSRVVSMLRTGRQWFCQLPMLMENKGIVLSALSIVAWWLTGISVTWSMQ